MKKRSSPKQPSSSTKCFLCNQVGHYARNCPNKRKRTQFLLQLKPHLQDGDDDLEIETLFLLDNDPSDAILAISHTDSELPARSDSD
nr:hypothetical protein [Klebsiella pneumoniae]